MALAIFDLDNTLLAGDSDHAWGEFLVSRNIVDGALYKQTNDRFFQDYQSGSLDILAYLEFALKPLAAHPLAQLHAWREDFMRTFIAPMILPKGRALIESHRQRGDQLLIITATNRFVTEPIAQALGIAHLIATEPEFTGERYTGRIAGTPSFREGKITRLNEWLSAQQHDLAGATFYSDSHNDIPLLEQVDFPVAVDPDDQLRDVARQRAWPVITLRETA